MSQKRTLNLFDLVLLNIVAIVGLRWITKAGHVGPAAIILWILAFLFFFIPQGFVVARLSQHFPELNGIYGWTKKAFGKKHGFIAGFFYWSNNLIYYPSLFVFLAGISVHAFGLDSKYEDHKLYVAGFSLAILWTAILINVIGLNFGKWLNNLGALGTWIPGFILILMALLSGLFFGTNLELSYETMVVPLSSLSTWSMFSAMCFAFAGLELASILSKEAHHPEKSIPRAIIISGFFITFIYITGTFSLLVAFKPEQIDIITGIVETLSFLSQPLGLGKISQFSALLILIGGLGGIGAWLVGTARIPFEFGIDHYFPKAFAKRHNRFQTPYIAILFQGVASTIFIFISFLGSTVEDAYLLLLDMTIIVYFIPYIYMFLSAGKLLKQLSPLISLFAGIGTIVTMLGIGFNLMPNNDVESPYVFILKMVGGLALFLITALILLRRHNVSTHNHDV